MCTIFVCATKQKKQSREQAWQTALTSCSSGHSLALYVAFLIDSFSSSAPAAMIDGAVLVAEIIAYQCVGQGHRLPLIGVEANLLDDCRREEDRIDRTGHGVVQ